MLYSPWLIRMHYRRLNRSYRKTERDKDPDIVWIFVTLASLISFTHYKGPTAEVLLVILYTLKYSQFRKSLALSQEHTKADSLYPLDPIFSLFPVSSFCAAMELCMMSNSNRTLAANSRCPVAIFCHRICRGCRRTQPRASFSINIYFLQTAWLDSLQAVCVCFKACAVRRINSSPGAFLSVFETSTISW